MTISLLVLRNQNILFKMPRISSFGKILKKNNIHGSMNGGLIISFIGNGIKKSEKMLSGENHKTCDHPDILKPMHECAYCGGGGCSHC